MRAVRLTKKMMQDPVNILKAVGAVDQNTNTTLPNCVFMNSNDYQILRKNVTKAYKKEYPYLKPDSRKLNSSVEFHLLNFGPVELKKGIERGYILVDDHLISETIMKSEKINGV